MASAEERMVMHLANIGNNLFDLVKEVEKLNKGIEAINNSLVEFTKVYREINEGLSPEWAKKEGE